MYPQLCLIYGSKFFYDKYRQAVTRNFKFTTDIAVFFSQIMIVWQNQIFSVKNILLSKQFETLCTYNLP